jgi:hypothetical protein
MFQVDLTKNDLDKTPSNVCVMQRRKKDLTCLSVTVRGYCTQNLSYGKLSFCLHIINPHPQRTVFSILPDVAMHKCDFMKYNDNAVLLPLLTLIR